MRDREILETIAEAILTGGHVDWDGEAADSSPELRELLTELRIVAGIADLHRAIGSSELSSSSSGAALSHQHDDTTDWPSAIPWGPLRLLEPVGAGASGVVYRAWDTRLDREVALKLLHDRPARDGGAIQEGRLLARLRHPNIVTVYGAEQYDGRAGVWMEFVHGRTLEAIVASRGAVGWREASAIAITICRALDAVHSAGLLHRDLKTHNVMIEPSGRVVVMDFHASRLAAMPVGAEMVGTPLFLAPEILLGQHQASVQSDVYSTGVVIYRLLTGAYPVEGATLEGLRRAVQTDTAVSLRDLRPDVPGDLVAAVESALHRDPNLRTRTAGDLAAALERASVPRPDVGHRWSPTQAALWVPASVLATLCGLALATLSLRPPAPGASTRSQAGRAGAQGGPGPAAGQATGALLTMAQLDWGSFVPVNGPTSDGSAIAGLVGLEPAVRDLLTGDVRVLQRQEHEDDAAGTPAISPDQGRVAYVWFRADGEAQHVEVRVAPFHGGPWRRVMSDPRIRDITLSGWTPDGAALVASVSHDDGTGTISLIDVDDGRVRPLRRFTDEPPTRAVLSPDGSVIAYDVAETADPSHRDVFVIDVRTGDVRPLVVERTNDLWPSWSADSRSLTFASDRGGSLALWAIDVDDTQARSAPRLIKANMGRFRPLGVTRAGDFYFLVVSGAMDVYRVALDELGELTSSPSTIADTFVGQNVDGDWSPDGKAVAYVSRRGEVPFDRQSMSLVVRDLASGSERRFTPDVDGAHDPSWAPEGRTLFFGGRLGNSDRLYTLSIDDGAIRPVEPTPGLRGSLRWSSDGARLYGTISRKGRWGIGVREIATGRERDIAWPTNMVWAISPDERWVATTRSDSGRPVITVMHVGETRWRDLFGATAEDRLFPIGWTTHDELLVSRTASAVDGSPVTEVWALTVSESVPSTSRKLGVVSGLASPRKFRIRPDGRELLFTAGAPHISPWVLQGPVR